MLITRDGLAASSKSNRSRSIAVAWREKTLKFTPQSTSVAPRGAVRPDLWATPEPKDAVSADILVRLLSLLTTSMRQTPQVSQIGSAMQPVLACLKVHHLRPTLA